MTDQRRPWSVQTYEIGVAFGRAEGFEQGFAIGMLLGGGLAALVVVTCVWWLN